MHSFTFAGKNSRDFGVYISGGGTYNAPERDVTTYSVPGRNGDLIVDNGRFLNTAVSYESFIPRGFPNKAEQLRLWLKSVKGYQRLEDDYHPNFFRMAYYSNAIDFSTHFLNRSAEFTLTFTCKPQRFLKSGEFPVTIAESGDSLYNPYMEALPIIQLTGNGAGTLVVNDVTVTVKDMSGSLILDCDLQNAYSGTTNENSNINAPVFPTLTPGENVIGWSGGITGVSIIPRWWTI